MDRIYINKLDRNFNLDLCKVNRDIICGIPLKYLKSIQRNILDMDKLEIVVDKYIYQNTKKIINPLWYEMKEERLVCLNSSEFFILKVNRYESSSNTKSFTAYSSEFKIGKIDIKLEDLGIYLLGKDEENSVYSLNELLEIDTGWSFGHIDDSVLYDIDEEGNKTEKLRWQESVNARWYDFIKNNICESFGCIPHYDTFNKKINLYDIKTFGENIELYLSNDNYIKELERVGSSEDIVTRLYLVGNEEMDIIGATVTGYPYVENYDYFMNNGEMSDELVSHLKKHYEMVSIREPIWKSLVKEKSDKLDVLTRKKSDLFIVYEEIRAKKSIKEVYSSQGDSVNEAIIAEELTKLIDQQVVLEVEIKTLEEDIENLTESIIEINILCKRETATDENGEIIFNEVTLSELKDFVYCDTYSNGDFLDVYDLIKAGERELEMQCFPTHSYSLDLKNFLNRTKNNGFNKHWNGDIGLGDIIILYDEDLQREVMLYLNGYTQYPSVDYNENELDIEISNKKLIDNSVRIIADRLKESELSMKLINRKVHLLNKQKYNRINLSKDKIDSAL